MAHCQKSNISDRTRFTEVSHTLIFKQTFVHKFSPVHLNFLQKYKKLCFFTFNYGMHVNFPNDDHIN